MKLYKEAMNFLIIGAKGSGKSMTGWSILQTQCIKGKRLAFIYLCPKPELLRKVPFKLTNLTQLSHLFHLRDSVCLIDEANLHFDVKSKQINDDLKQLLQLSRQNNTTFIFIVHNSYVFNRGLFGYMDVKIIKAVTEHHWELERAHMKKLYRSIRVSGVENMYIDCEEMKGYAQTKKLDWFTDDFSKIYRLSSKPKILFESKCATNPYIVRDNAKKNVSADTGGKDEKRRI